MNNLFAHIFCHEKMTIKKCHFKMKALGYDVHLIVNCSSSSNYKGSFI